ncbi:MAG: ankyrin repeat domain-containing protein [Phycisphaerales bacterium]
MKKQQGMSLNDRLLRRDLEGFERDLAAGADLEERDRDGRTPLMNATGYRLPHIVSALISRGANVNAQDRRGWTALHFTAQEYEPALATLLIQNGASVDLADAHGNTPLSTAVFECRGRGEMIAMLLRAGANKDLPNAHGVSPASLAATIANYDVAQFFRPETNATGTPTDPANDTR